MTEKYYPRAYVLRYDFVDERKGNATVVIHCPLCPNEHIHSGQIGERGDRGHRISHCWTPYDRWNRESGVESYMPWDDRPLKSWEKRWLKAQNRKQDVYS